MPLYEYACDSCGGRFERIQKFADPPVQTCPTCGGAVRKLISSPAIQFKGSGWYVTDYAKAAQPARKEAGDGGKGASESASSSDSSTPSSAGSEAPAAKASSSAESSTSAPAKSQPKAAGT